MAKGKIDIPLKKGKITGGTMIYNFDASSKKGAISIDNSFTIGIGTSISLVNLEANFDMYQMGKAMSYLYKSGEEYVKETIQKMKNVKGQVPE